MTRRETTIAKAILDFLHDLDYGQAQEIVIHAGACEKFLALIPLSEFESVFQLCAREGWLDAVPRRFKGTLWSISAAGEKARLEMR